MAASELGKLLVKEGFLTEQDRQTIGRTCGHESAAFAKSIISMGMLDEQELSAFIAANTKFSVASKNFLSEMQADALTSLDIHMLARLEVIPLEITSTRMRVAMLDPVILPPMASRHLLPGRSTDLAQRAISVRSGAASPSTRTKP